MDGSMDGWMMAGWIDEQKEEINKHEQMTDEWIEEKVNEA